MPGELGDRDRAVESVAVLDRGRVARHEARRHHGLLQPERGHLREEHRARVGGVLPRVVVGADIGSRSAARERERRHRTRPLPQFSARTSPVRRPAPRSSERAHA